MTVGAFGGFGGNLGFGIAFALEDRFTDTARAITAQLTALGMGATALADTVSLAMDRISIGFKAVTLAVAMLASYVHGARIDADMQRWEYSFSSYLGSVAAGAEYMKKLKDLAVLSPFEMKDLTSGSQMLMQLDIGAQRTLNLLTSIGNLTAHAGKGSEELGRLLLALQHAGNKGFFDQRLGNMFAYAGVNIVKILKEAGIQIDNVNDKAALSKVTFEQVEYALNKVAGAGGRLGSAMEEYSLLISGRWSKLMDVLYLGFSAIGRSIRDVTAGLIDALIEAIQRFTEWAATPMGQFVLRMVFFLGVLIGVLGILGIVSGATRLSMGLLARSFGEATAATIMQTYATQGLAAAMRSLLTAFWASYGTFILIAAGIMLVWSAMDGTTNRIRQTAGHVQDEAAKALSRWGTVFDFMHQVWTTWDGYNFELKPEMAKLLGGGPLNDFFTGVAQWTIGMDDFFAGVGNGFLTVLAIGAYALGALGKVLDWLISGVVHFFAIFGLEIDNNKASLEKWAILGNVVGAILGMWLTYLAGRFIWLGIVSVAAAVRSGIAWLWNARMLIPVLIEEGFWLLMTAIRFMATQGAAILASVGINVYTGSVWGAVAATAAFLGVLGLVGLAVWGIGKWGNNGFKGPDFAGMMGYTGMKEPLEKPSIGSWWLYPETTWGYANKNARMRADYPEESAEDYEDAIKGINDIHSRKGAKGLTKLRRDAVTYPTEFMNPKFLIGMIDSFAAANKNDATWQPDITIHAPVYIDSDKVADKVIEKASFNASRRHQ